MIIYKKPTDKHKQNTCYLIHKFTVNSRPSTKIEVQTQKKLTQSISNLNQKQRQKNTN